ncbi:MAG: glycerophosphodiester phosphodiesterase [Acidobacteriota bacterium]
MSLRLPRPPWIVGHRGAAGEAPENTLASLALALEQGADMIEIDVQLTADGGLVVFHDESLERLAGSDLRTESVDRAALAALRVGSFGGQAIGIPGLGEAIAALPADCPLNIELKRQSAATARLAAGLVEQVEGRCQVLVSSFDWPLLEEVRRLGPTLPLALLIDDLNAPDAASSLVAAADRLEAWSIHVSAKAAEAALRGLASGPRPVICYTVNDAIRAQELFSWGVSGVFTDFPGRLRLALGLSPGPQFH